MKRLKNFLLITAVVAFLVSISSVYAVFDDVSENDWFYSYVNEAYIFGFVNGRTEALFCPDENLTVAEALKLADVLFINIMKLDIELENGSPWYSTYLDFAKSYNLVDHEYSDYNAPISRRDFVGIFYNAIPPQNLFEYIDIADGSIPDVSADDEYYNRIYSFYRAGILTGRDENGSFFPQERILRSEVCAVLMRIFYMNAFEIELDNSSSDGFIPSSPPPESYVTFNLENRYSDVIIPQTEKADSDYINSTVFIGDSLSVGLRAFKILPDSNVLAAGSIDPQHAMNDELIMLPTAKKVTIPDACDYYQPKKAVITLGTNSVSWRDPDDFISLYSQFIDMILDRSPNTQIIIQSIPPVSEEYESKGSKITNKRINTFNEHLAELCRKRGLPFLNTASMLKNERGYLDDQYQSGDGLHLNKSAYRVWIDYFATHALPDK